MPLATFADLAPFRSRGGGGSPLDSLIQGFQQGNAAANLPETLANQQLNAQLQQAILRQKLADLANPEQALARDVAQQLAVKSALNPNLGIGMAPQGLSAETIFQPGTAEVDKSGNITQLTPRKAPITPITVMGVPTGLNQNLQIPIDEAAKAAELARQAELAKPFTLGKTRFAGDGQGGATQIAKETESSKNVAKQEGNEIVVRDSITQEVVRREPMKPGEKLVSRPNGIFRITEGTNDPGQLIEGTAPSGTATSMKPTERIQIFKTIRDVYDDSSPKIQFFGRGQQLGSDQLMTNLDATLKGAGGDFNKISPSGKANFAYAFNKLNDPTSATLLSEFNVIANRLGVYGRLQRFLGKQVDGSDITPEVAKDLYNVISQVHSAQKENLINDLIERKSELDEIGKPLTSIGVPKRIADEVEARINKSSNVPSGLLSTSNDPLGLFK